MLLQDVLKKPEYFGKFGKIHKVVINQNTAYAGSQTQVGSGKFPPEETEERQGGLQQLFSSILALHVKAKFHH